MSAKPNSLFDTAYVETEQSTTGVAAKKSEMKQFLKNPIAAEDIKQYGTSKPSRTVIRASLQHGKS